MEQDQEDNDKTALENARFSYQVAVDLLTYQGNLNWNRFTVMLTANSIILTIIGFILPSQAYLTSFKLLLVILGLALCISWLFLTARGFDYHNYWGTHARKLEKKAPLKGKIDIFSNTEIHYQLTRVSLAVLKEMNSREEVIPEEVINKIDELIKQESKQSDFSKKREFLNYLKKKLDKKLYRRYRKKILLSSRQGKIEFKWLSVIGGSQKNSTYFVIYVFMVLYILVIFQIY